MHGDKTQEVDAVHVQANRTFLLGPGGERSDAAVGVVCGLVKGVSGNETPCDCGEGSDALFHAPADEALHTGPRVYVPVSKCLRSFPSHEVHRLEAHILQESFLRRVPPVHRADPDSSAGRDRVHRHRGPNLRDRTAGGLMEPSIVRFGICSPSSGSHCGEFTGAVRSG